MVTSLASFSSLDSAKRLTTGKAIGIDIWLPNAGGGTEHTFWKNAHVEGLERRVELQNVDARQMPFEDKSFDVIVSTFALHHIGHGAADREQALREMLARRRQLRERARVSLPSFKGRGLQPGVDLEDRSALLHLMDQPDAPR